MRAGGARDPSGVAGWPGVAVKAAPRAPAAAQWPHHAGQLPTPAGVAVNWFATPVGHRLLLDEQRAVIPLLTQHIGVRGLYLRPHASAPPTLSGNMLQSVLNLHQHDGGIDGELRADVDALPIESDALCLAYALHSLDCCAAPATLVEELRRVLRPEGVLFLIGLSPFSPWRLRWMRSGLHARPGGRVRTLLGEAGFAVELQVGLGPVMPFPGVEHDDVPAPQPARDSLLDDWRAGYLLIARKRRVPLTPVGARPRAAVGALQPQARAG
jgi:SAM-dependent methyltransferase